MLGLLLALSSCTYNSFPPKVDTRTEIKYSYKRNKNYEISKWRKSKKKIAYDRYDQKGNIIEEGTFGERWDSTIITVNADSSVSIARLHGRNYKKLNTIHYYTYDSIGKKLKEEFWRFKDNIKDYLVYKTIFEYDARGRLAKETEFDNDNEISRLQDYSKEKINQESVKDSIYNFTFDGITTAKNKKQDIVITDSLGRPIEKIYYRNDKFSHRQEFRYDELGLIVTEIRYNYKPDSLWCITEWKYNFNKQLIRKFSKIIGDTTDTRDIYIYNRKKLLIKILHYSQEKLEGYTRYKYKLY